MPIGSCSCLFHRCAYVKDNIYTFQKRAIAIVKPRIEHQVYHFRSGLDFLIVEPS